MTQQVPDISEPGSEAWQPSSDLRAPLSSGVWAALIAGSLGAGAGALEWLQGNQPGFTPAMGLEFAAYFAALWVVAAFWQLGSDLASTGLGRSCLGLFGTSVLLEVLGLADDAIFPQKWVAVLILLAVVVGWLVLLAVLFSGDGPKTTVSQETAPPSAAVGPRKAARAGPWTLVGGALIALAVLGKVLAKGAFKFLVLARLLRFLKVELIEGIASGILIVSLLGFMIWFGVALIRLRGKLGAWAALLGWGTLLDLGLVFALLIWLGLPIAAEAAKDNPDQKLVAELTDAAVRTIGVMGCATSIVAAILTALLFLSVRERCLAPTETGAAYEA
jgi:hypothetical protein